MSIFVFLKIHNIMCQIELINRRIDKVQMESLDDTKIIDSSVDTLLDNIIEAERMLKLLISSTNKLYKTLSENFTLISEDESKDVIARIHQINKTLRNIIKRYRKINFNDNINKGIYKLNNNIEALSEIENDIRIFRIELPNDEEFKKLISDLNTL